MNSFIQYSYAEYYLATKGNKILIHVTYELQKYYKQKKKPGKRLHIA